MAEVQHAQTLEVNKVGIDGCDLVFGRVDLLLERANGGRGKAMSRMGCRFLTYNFSKK